MLKAAGKLIVFLKENVEEIRTNKQITATIEGVEFKMFIPNAQTVKLAVTYGLSYDPNSKMPYDDSVLKTIEIKNSNEYSTKPTWLLLKESTSQSIIIDCNVLFLHERIKAIPTLKFESIYLKPGWFIGTVYPHPTLFRLFPSLTVYY